MKKGLLCLALATAVSNITLPQVAHGEETTESTQELQERYDAALAQYDLGSAGFFQYIVENATTDAEREDAQLAYNIITGNASSSDGYNPNKLIIYTKLGEANDATNLENMKKAIDELGYVNQYRQKENTDKGMNLADVKISNAVMAIAQYDLNYSKSNLKETYSFLLAENLSWGRSNPFDGWYDEERAKAESGITDSNLIGHYQNIVYEDNKTMGYAYVPQSDAIAGVVYNDVYALVLNYAIVTYVRYEDDVVTYQAKFNTYYNEVKKELADAKQALEDSGVKVPDQDQKPDTTPDQDNTGNNNGTNSDNNSENNADTNKENKPIKDTAAESSSIALVTLAVMGVAFVITVGKKKKA